MIIIVCHMRYYLVTVHTKEVYSCEGDRDREDAPATPCRPNDLCEGVHYLSELLLCTKRDAHFRALSKQS